VHRVVVVVAGGVVHLRTTLLLRTAASDYLSDESEAELQRQAEEKAALFAQIQAEELEFKMARQQLAQIGLRPPKSWNPINASSTPLPGNTFPPPRNSVTTAPSFGAAVAAMVEGAQARG